MKRVMIIAGEASGDLHAAKVVSAIRRRRDDVQFFGIGGQHMRDAGVKVLVDSAAMAVVGIVEILAHRKVIFGALAQMRQILRDTPPDLLLLVDYPEFNIRLAKTAKQCGVKVFYYISPQIWAWRQHRVKTIKRVVDIMAVVFPFEVDFYSRHQVPVKFVGHPLVDEVHASADNDLLKKEFHLDHDKPVIGLFPGSRNSEIKRLLPILLQSARLLKIEKADAQFILPQAHTIPDSELNTILAAFTDLDIHVIASRVYDVMSVCDAIATVSGTVTLEIALMHKPMVIINRVAFLTYFIVSHLLKIDHVGLCNIIANRSIVPELLQRQATAENIKNTLVKILDDSDYRATMIRDLEQIEAMLGEKDGINTAAELVLEYLPA